MIEDQSKFTSTDRNTESSRIQSSSAIDEKTRSPADTSELLSPVELASLLGVKVSTLAAWRHRGSGPSFIKLPGSGLVRYRTPDVMKWLGGEACRSTSEAGCRFRQNDGTDG